MAAPSTKVIGILGGMGPRSTGPFIDEVVNECQSAYGARLDDDFPQMNIISLPTPFRVDSPIDHEAMKRSIKGGLRQLEATGVTFLAMPCNSAHIYFDELKGAVAVPLLNIIEETLAQVARGSRVTLFATKATFESELYQKGVTRAGAEFKFDLEWQPLINATISAIKAGNLDTARIEWAKLLDGVKREGIQTIISACTDLNVVARLHESSTTFIDSGKSLAKAVVREYLKK